MTGKAYYITTLADWQRHAARFANSHFIVLAAPANAVIPSEPAVFAGDEGSAVALHAPHEESDQQIPRTDQTPIGTRNDTASESSVEVEGQGFSPDTEAGPPSRQLVEPGRATRAERDTSGGRSFSSDINDGREAPSAAQVHPQHVVEDPRGADHHASYQPDVRILVLIEADEGVHLSLDDDPAFEPLPHPLAQKSISPAAQSALAPHGVASGATTFDAAEALSRVHPLLRHRVF
jgi:hypothetical protein